MRVAASTTGIYWDAIFFGFNYSLEGLSAEIAFTRLPR